MQAESAVNKKFQKEMTAGVTSLVLLNLLSKFEEPMYGYQIAKLLQANEDELLSAKQGALYPVLRSLEKFALLESKVEPSVSGPPRRYYSITSLGSEVLPQWNEIWKKTKKYIDRNIEGDFNDDK